MKKILLAALAGSALASGANALTLTNAAVTGPTGTVWTTAHTGNYTLFLQTPGLGDFLNPHDESINLGVASNGITRALLAGDGYPVGGNADSDPLYNLTLSFDGGQTLTGVYTPTTNTFVAGSSFSVGNQTYSLIEFSYRRDLGDAVSQNVAVPGGDGNDYNGNFRIQATGAVPEPATWALMIGGFTMVGAAARRRARATTMAA